MVSKNNHQVYQQKLAERKQRWGIRKLSVGVASVLLGTTFMLYSNHAVLADTVPTNTHTTLTGHNVADLPDSLRTTAEEKGVATNHQGTPQGQDTTQNTTNEKGITPNVWAARLLAALVVNPTSTDPKEASTSLPMSNKDIKLDSQPMLKEIINKPKDNWVYKNMKWYPGASTEEVKEILKKHTTNDDSGRYYFAGAVNYNESYHVVYLLARSNNLNDNQLYVTILHTLTGNTQEEVVAPGKSKKVEYNGTGGTTHPPIFTNYDGTSVSIDLDGVEKGDKKTYGMVVGFAYGYDTGIYGEPASMGNGFMTTPMPTKVTTTIHYVDQATGDELAVPKSFEGVAYQKYTITGEAPTIDGYTLKKSPNTTGYISPYKVGESYDFRLDKHVVVKQTVIDSQGLVRVTAYYDGEAIGNTTKYLGNIPDVNDYMSFFAPNGKSYAYINQIISTNDGIVYYYAKDGSEDKSEVRVHYIDVTGNKSSLFVPGDGKEVATDKISGKLGETYNYNVNVPTDYNLATNQANTVKGTYTIDHHDEYVYVVKKTSAEKITPNVPTTKEPVADPSHLTTDEQAKVQQNVEDANKDENGKSTLPEGTTVTVDDKGNATVTYPDHSTDTIKGSDLVRPATDAEKTTPKVPAKEPVADPSHLTTDEQAKVQQNVEDANKDENGKSTLPEGTTVTVDDKGNATVTYPDHSTDTIEGSKLVRPATDADNYNPEVVEITVNRNTKLGPTEAKEAIKNAQSLPNGTTYSWYGKKLPDTSTSGSKDGWVVVTYPDTSHDIVPVKINVKKDAESYTVTPNNEVSVDKGEDVDPASLVTVTDPDGKQVQLPAGSIDWKDGAKPDLTTPGDKTGSVEVTFLDGSKKDTDVTIHVKTDAETYDPQAQPWTTTVGKTPKADEVISSTDKNGKKMPSDANYTWKTEPNTSKIGEASGEVTVNYDDGSHDDVPVTINVKDKLNDNEKYHIYGKDGLKVDKGQTLDPKDAIDVKDADGKETTLPEGSTVGWTKKPDFSQAGKDVTGEVTVTYPGPDGSKSDPVTVTVHVNGESDKYKVAPKDNVIVPRGSQVEPESTVVAQTPDGKPTSFPDGTKHEWITKPDTDSTGKRTGVVKTTFQDGSTTTTTVSVTVEPNQSDNYDPKGPKNSDDRVPVKDPEHLTKGDKDKVKDEVGTVNPNLPKDTEVEVDDKGNATIKYPDKSTDTIPGGDLVRPTEDKDNYDPKGPKNPDDRVPVKDPEHLTKGDKDKVKDEVGTVNPNLPKDTEVEVDDKGNATIKYPDKSTDTIPGGDLVRPTEDKDNYDPKGPKNPDDRVPVKDPEHLTKGDKDKVKGEDSGSTSGQTDAGNITPTIPGGKVTVKDPNHLTDDEKNQVKKNVEDANKGSFSAGTVITVGDDGTTTVTYPDGSKDVIAGTDLVIAAKSEDVLGSKHHSHKNGSNSSHADGVKGASTANGSIANAGNNL
ncbi:Rib/alpha-like domain-containing protein, partial [Lactobacillus sp. UMNPBX17]|uniref:Rib/alpha-like domain-containing protein n=1 Tax=Lactobacillus sp. UMNPBX17 TaxID=2042030 RepID=UPI000BEEE51F